MASTRITCPDCRSVLKPTKPVPDGKKVKCPQCGNLFTTPGLVEDEEQPRKKAAGKKEKAASKKTPTSPPPPDKPAYREEDEESDGGIYGYIAEDEKEKEEEEEKPQIDYTPDMSIKDLRGPAQAAVVRPSNYIILIGGLSCLCDILIICICFWPMVFSDSPVDYQKVLENHYKNKQNKSALDRIKGIKERSELKDEDEEVVEEAESAARLWRFLYMGIYIFLLVYSAIAIVGAVKMQNLESRGWGIAASIMTILPFGSSGLSGVVGILTFILFAVLLDDAGLGMMYAGGCSTLVWIFSIVVGAWSLRTLMSQEVIDGFSYVAD